MSVNLKTNLSIKKKIVVNGHEYGSVEELPDDLRQAYNRAMSTVPELSKAKIVFNGREYGSKEEMPSEVRSIYEIAMAAAKMKFPFQEWKSDEKAPISPAGVWKKEFTPSEKAVAKVSVSGSGTRWFLLGLGIFLGLGVLYFLNLR